LAPVLGRSSLPDHRWRAHLERSALVLRRLTYAPTGVMQSLRSTMGVVAGSAIRPGSKHPADRIGRGGAVQVHLWTLVRILAGAVVAPGRKQQGRARWPVHCVRNSGYRTDRMILAKRSMSRW
jgi:hypothetical protein